MSSSLSSSHSSSSTSPSSSSSSSSSPPSSSCVLPEPLSGCEAVKLLSRLLDCSSPADVQRLLKELDVCYTQLFQLLLPPAPSSPGDSLTPSPNSYQFPTLTPCSKQLSRSSSGAASVVDPRPLYVLALSDPILLLDAARWERAADDTLAQLAHGVRVCEEYLTSEHELVLLHSTCLQAMHRWRAQRPLLSHAMTPQQLQCFMGFLAPIQSETVRVVGHMETQLHSAQQTVGQLQKRLKQVESLHISLHLNNQVGTTATPLPRHSFDESYLSDQHVPLGSTGTLAASCLPGPLPPTRPMMLAAQSTPLRLSSAPLESSCHSSPSSISSFSSPLSPSSSSLSIGSVPVSPLATHSSLFDFCSLDCGDRDTERSATQQHAHLSKRRRVSTANQCSNVWDSNEDTDSLLLSSHHPHSTTG